MIGTKAMLYASAIGLFFLLVNSNGNVHIEAKKVECEDVKGEIKWGTESHDDNTPSNKKFEKMLDGKATICEISKEIDHMNAKGTVKDWSDFKETFVYLSAEEKVQDCLKDQYDLGDSLADYEIMECASY